MTDQQKAIAAGIAALGVCTRALWAVQRGIPLIDDVIEVREKAWEARNSMEKALAGPEWLPIATAPKDGTPIDLWVDGRRVPDASYHAIAVGSPTGRWWCNGALVLDTPTHYRELPAPPEGT